MSRKLEEAETTDPNQEVRGGYIHKGVLTTRRHARFFGTFLLNLSAIREAFGEGGAAPPR